MPATKKAGAAKKAAAKTVLVWEDDPLSEGASPVARPVPKLPEAPLGLTFVPPQPAVGHFDPGTPEFRWWTAADALSRAVTFWKGFMPKGTTWKRGTELPVRLDDGEDLNAYYDRSALRFYHADVKGTMVFTGDSPDVLAHECGHAVLDAVRPELYGSASHETAAFHESFGDISALLTSLQLASIRTGVLTDTQGVVSRSSRASRIAEQLGWGARQWKACSVEPDCLRNAANCFVYQPADELPIGAPAVALSSAAHSYSRVFTGAFLGVLANMVEAITDEPTEADLLKATKDAATLLIGAVRSAPVQPNYFSQVAGAFSAAADTKFDGRYRTAARDGFARRGLLAATTSVATVASALRAREAVSETSGRPRLVTLGGYELGLGDVTVVCEGAAEGAALPVNALARDASPLAAPSAEHAARLYLRELLVRGDVVMPGESERHRRQTHELVEEGGALRLYRRCFAARVAWPGGGRAV